jgi:hypothetical protein
MNPGKVIHPRKLDENLALRGWKPPHPVSIFSYLDDEFMFSKAATRCVGLGKCRGDHLAQLLERVSQR